MGRALPGLAFEQVRRGRLKEDLQCAVRFGDIQGTLQGTRRGVGIAEGVAGDRLQQEHTPPKRDLWLAQGGLTRPRSRYGAVENRRQRSDRFLGVVLAESEHRQAHAH